MRLIDADALKEFYGKWANRNTEFMKGEVDGYIDAQPTIDAAPVVRCKDCWKRGNPRECPMCHEECVGYDWEDSTDDEWWPIDQTEDDGFCYVGEKERSPQ